MRKADESRRFPVDVLRAHVAHARQKMNRALDQRKPAVTLRTAEVEALFAAIQLGRVLAVERKVKTELPWWQRLINRMRAPDDVRQNVEATLEAAHEAHGGRDPV